MESVPAPPQQRRATIGYVEPTVSGEREDERPRTERWRRLPPRVRPEEWIETVPAAGPKEAPIVVGNGVAYRSGMPLPD
jgi:hypothetical protein